MMLFQFHSIRVRNNGAARKPLQHQWNVGKQLGWGSCSLCSSKDSGTKVGLSQVGGATDLESVAKLLNDSDRLGKYPDVYAFDVHRLYTQLEGKGKVQFFQVLYEHLKKEEGVVDQEALPNPWKGGMRKESTVYTMLKNIADYGMLGHKALLDMRSDLIGLIEETPSEHEPLKVVNRRMQTMLADWYSPKKMRLERVTESSNKILLQRVQEFEAVHPFRDEKDLHSRLEKGRRLYVFTHPLLPSHPLAFVNVALMDELPSSIQPILDGTAINHQESAATHCIFYSITSAQKGLAGIDVGKHLIKSVHKKMKTELPRLETFATLSPLPNFLQWIFKSVDAEDQLLSQADFEALERLMPEASSPNEALKEILQQKDWHLLDDKSNVLQGILMRLGFRYLLQEKKPGNDQVALDPVCNFHIRNGAQLERLNWLADTSTVRMSQSGGIMVNYNYTVPDIRANEHEYANTGKIAISRQVQDLLKHQAS